MAPPVAMLDPQIPINPLGAPAMACRSLCLLLLAALLSIGGLSACGSSGSSTSPTPQPESDTPEEEEPEEEEEPGPTDPLAGGVRVMTEAPASDFSPYVGDNDGPVGSMTTVEADHPAFDQAVRIDVDNPSGAYWNGQLQYPIETGVVEDEVLFIRLYMRSVSTDYETGTGFTTVFLEGPEPDYTKHVEREITSTGDWERYDIPVVMGGAENAGELMLKIGFGAGDRPQVFDIGGVEVLSFGTDKDASSLPETELSYLGRDPDADWRAEAEERIERHRKGDFTVRVVDADGAPVPEAEVSVEMTRHAYHFGSVMVGHILTGEGEDNQTYRNKLRELFNQSGPENDLKWPTWAGDWGPPFNRDTTLDALQWLKDNDFYVRGHVMVWPSKTHLPDDIQRYLPEGAPENADPEAKQMVLDHIDDVASATADRLHEWDVLNEPYDNHYLMDAFGDEVMVDWFEQARQNLPNHKLYINDYAILSAGGRDAQHQQHFEDTIGFLREQGAPLDGIGMQGHFGASPTAIPRVYEVLERFDGAFEQDLDIRVTEFDVNTADRQLQADYTRDFLTIVFSHPATVGVQNWGFWAGAHYQPRAAMFTEDWEEKPNANAWDQLVNERWRTRFDATTDADGKVSEKSGFYGDYTVTVTVDGQSQTYEVALPPGSEEPAEFTLEWAH